MGATSELFIEMQDELINSVKQAEEGEISILDVAIQFEKQKGQLEDALKFIKQFKDDNAETIAGEAAEYPDGYKGFKIEYRNGATRYDYKGIPDWVKANDHKKEVEDKYKAMLKAKLKGSSFANVSEDGEELPMPEMKYSKSSIVLKAIRRR